MLEKALTQELYSKELYNNLGIAYYATKENVKAKNMFESAVGIDPNYKPALDNLKNIQDLS